MGATNNAALAITISGKEYCINVGREIVRVLGCPAYICLLESDKQHTIAIVPCDESVMLSFKVPKGFPENTQKKLRIYSQSLVTEIVSTYRLEMERSYTIKGEFDESMNAVVFHLDQLRVFSRREPVS